jgi:hypothetical protein
MEIKICSRCKLRLPIDEFYKDKSKPSGIAYRCKRCEAYLKREQRIRNKDTFKKKDRLYYKEHKKELLKKRKIWAEKNRQKITAHNLVRKALYHGELKRVDICEICFKSKSSLAHHDNYNKPLDVKWVCALCHMRLHHGK